MMMTDWQAGRQDVAANDVDDMTTIQSNLCIFLQKALCVYVSLVIVFNDE